ncbi:fructose-bisphosphatase [Helicobacter enhydrae]|uniref:Fructose-1,6-bisphosphatase class 1 n=1 Tax=Helicobacter enhydrae TaxID=222136 RepID=A0A1B1U6V6_9HELI|nr:class 1 fructose-bisphosphatase [Helicobacter enhydrae]ANV98537.1 fructose-bisphosphatase [Helicobacter enhydrae]
MQTIIDCFSALGVQIRDLIAQGDTHYTQTQNTSGDIQLALDIQSDQLIAEALLKLPSVKAICSEENGEITPANPQANLLVAYDPIDGSSLLPGNLSVGTIFGIYQDAFEAQNLIASGYILYGLRLEMVTAYRHLEGAFLQRYDLQKQAWSDKETLKLQTQGIINASGGTQKEWTDYHKAMIDELFNCGYRLRYCGGMVPDLHQILLKGGGLFSYPTTAQQPQGKLRKLFEVFPFALIFQQAGGMATDGSQELLSLPTRHIHDTCGCFFGSQKEIQYVYQIYKERQWLPFQ